MSLFENRKRSRTVLTGVVLGTGVVSAVNQGVVGAVPHTDALNSFADKGVKNLDGTVLKFLKNNWGWFLLAVGLIATVGLIGYRMFFKKKNVENVVELDNSYEESGKKFDSNYINDIREEESVEKQEYEKKVKLFGSNDIKESDNKEKEKKEEVKEENEEKNEEKENILINNKMVDKDDFEKQDDFSIFNKKNVDFDKKDNPIVQKKQGEIDYIVKINAKEIKGKNLEKLKELKGGGSEDLDIFLNSIEEGISEGCYLFFDKDKNIFYIDEDGEKTSIKNDEGKNLRDVEGELISFMIEKGEYREGAVAVSVIGKIGLEKWGNFKNLDAVSIAENYKEVENHIVFVKKADEGNFEVSYVDEENFLCSFKAKEEEVISLFGEEKIKDKKEDYGEGINLGENNFNLLND